MTAIATRTPEFEASTAEPPRALTRRIDWTGLWFRIVEREGEFKIASTKVLHSV